MRLYLDDGGCLPAQQLGCMIMSLQMLSAHMAMQHQWLHCRKVKC